MVKKLNKIMGYYAFAGVFLAGMVHVLSLMGHDLQESFPFIWVIHLAIFPPFVFALIRALDDPEVKAIYKENPRGGVKLLKQLFRKSPGWFNVITLLLFIYGIVNFMLFMGNSEGGGPSIIDGQYVLSNHGEIIRYITEKEYHQFQANELRGFSGHWIIFFSISAGILWPFGENEI